MKDSRFVIAMVAMVILAICSPFLFLEFLEPIPSEYKAPNIVIPINENNSLVLNEYETPKLRVLHRQSNFLHPLEFQIAVQRRKTGEFFFAYEARYLHGHPEVKKLTQKEKNYVIEAIEMYEEKMPITARKVRN